MRPSSAARPSRSAASKKSQRAPQRRLIGSQQRLVGERAAPRPGDDRLRGHPELLDRATRTAPRAPPDRRSASPPAPGPGCRLAPHPRQLVHARPRASTDLHHRVGRDRLDQVAERAVLDRLQRALQRRAAGHEDHRHVEIGLADRAQQRQPVHVGHGDVADDGVEPLRLRQRRRLAPVVATRDLEAGGRQRARIAAGGDRLVIDDHHLGGRAGRGARAALARSRRRRPCYRPSSKTNRLRQVLRL